MKKFIVFILLTLTLLSCAKQIDYSKDINELKTQLGFLFMVGSALKFAVFFIVFQPIYKQDGEVSSLEFLAFFIPYTLCLIFETFSLSKLLNKLD